MLASAVYSVFNEGRGDNMDAKGREMIEAALRAKWKRRDLRRIVPERPEGNVRAMDVVVFSKICPSEIIDVLDEAGLYYREDRTGLQIPQLLYLGAYSVAATQNNSTADTVMTFEDTSVTRPQTYTASQLEVPLRDPLHDVGVKIRTAMRNYFR